MSDFVLLHGAWHGGWCWREVAALLRGAGHRVFTPTQTGLGERAHLMSRSITLETFVADLIGVLEAEELTQAVLVGHSFAGTVITGAADRVPERIRQLIYLDSTIPISGRSPLQGAKPEIEAERRAMAARHGGLSLPAPEPSSFGVPEGPEAAWLRRRMTPHPFGAWDSAITFAGAPGNGLPAAYVFCTAPVYGPLEPSRERARAVPGWRWIELAAGHDAMVTHPRETADLLMELAP